MNIIGQVGRIRLYQFNVLRLKAVLGECSDTGEGKTTQKTTQETTQETPEKTSEKILTLVGENTHITIAELASVIGVTGRSIERNIQKLQQHGKLKRVGPDKGGYWKVLR